MKLTRAIPALLALSMLTGCDMNAFLPKSGQNEKDPTPTTQTDLTLSQSDLKSVAAFQSGLTSAANQGATAAGSIGALKSVSGLKSVAAYRLSAITPPANDAWSAVDDGDGLGGKFTGEKASTSDLKGEGTADDEKAYYLKGTFTPMADFSATGIAMFKSVGTVAAADPGKFEGQIALDLTITSAPDSAKSLEGAKIDLEVTKPGGELTSSLTGTFGLLTAGATDPVKGKFGIQLFNDAWWVEVPSVDADGKLTFVKLNFSPDGTGSGTAYGSKQVDGKDVTDYDVKVATYTWNAAGKGKVKLIPSNKESEIQMPF